MFPRKRKRLKPSMCYGCANNQPCQLVQKTCKERPKQHRGIYSCTKRCWICKMERKYKKNRPFVVNPPNLPPLFLPGTTYAQFSSNLPPPFAKKRNVPLIVPLKPRYMLPKRKVNPSPVVKVQNPPNLTLRVAQKQKPALTVAKNQNSPPPVVKEYESSSVPAAASTAPDGFTYNLVEGRRKRHTKKLKTMSTSSVPAAAPTAPDGFTYNLVEGRRKRRTKKLKTMSTSRLHVSCEDYLKHNNLRTCLSKNSGTEADVPNAFCGAITKHDCLDVITKGRLWSDILVERLSKYVTRSTDRVEYFHVGSPAGVTQCMTIQRREGTFIFSVRKGMYPVCVVHVCIVCILYVSFMYPVCVVHVLS